MERGLAAEGPGVVLARRAVDEVSAMLTLTLTLALALALALTLTLTLTLNLTEVQAAHAAYVAALRALFDAHKADFGYGDRQLVVG